MSDLLFHTADIGGLEIPSDARALLVAPADDGTYQVRAVAQGESLLNIRRDLLKHLNEYPHTDEWLTQLRDYCDGRLAARQAAHEQGRIVVPNWEARWELI